MRPDQDERLTSMSIGEPTCEKCMMELYQNSPDNVCEDCQLNPMGKGNDEKFIKDVVNRETKQSFSKTLKRFYIINFKNRLLY